MVLISLLISGGLTQVGGWQLTVVGLLWLGRLNCTVSLIKTVVVHHALVSFAVVAARMCGVLRLL